MHSWRFCSKDREQVLSESDTIRAVLANRNLGTRLKQVTCTTVDSFKAVMPRQYAGIRYVHLGGHGSKAGLGFIGGAISWVDIGKKLIAMFPTLPEGQQRVLTLSCCYSRDGATALAKTLKGHFTAIYHFVPEKIGFSTAITTWSMFYLKKKLVHPHSAVKDSINKFMGEDILRFVPV
ncbi:hypothetical protein [Uliginosibacterium gangwonense]|uniref:hypothetical protein n=1 Tax=Uliginosibacterium gangwonense TaxID=392736 RepID=UPI001B7F8DEF|nr:hypothetical protein [Uliginosibacterium gangwonense]